MLSSEEHWVRLPCYSQKAEFKTVYGSRFFLNMQCDGSVRDLVSLRLLAYFHFLAQLSSQRASFSLRVSVMKAKNLMAKDANGETSPALNSPSLLVSKKTLGTGTNRNKTVIMWMLKSFFHPLNVSRFTSCQPASCSPQLVMAFEFFKVSEACRFDQQWIFKR